MIRVEFEAPVAWQDRTQTVHAAIILAEPELGYRFFGDENRDRPEVPTITAGLRASAFALSDRSTSTNSHSRKALILGTFRRDVG